MGMYGIDISSWQKGINLLAHPTDFIIMKASEGIGMEDNQLSGYINQVKDTNILLGLYHFARPDFNGTKQGMEKEADFFVSVVNKYKLLGRAILVLDWETEPIDRPDLIQIWLDRVLQLTGITPFIYGSASKLKSSTFKGFINRYPLWVAAWPSNKPIDGCRPYPGKLPSKDPLNWKIWQFSANGKWNGITVDCDYTEMSRFDWLDAQGYVEKTEEHISPDMQWAIDIGLYKGRTDGLYHPKDYLTREEAASLFKRYDDYLSKQFGYDD